MYAIRSYYDMESDWTMYIGFCRGSLESRGCDSEMDDFSVKPGVPNVYGVVGNTANEIQPGKRMLSSMS